MNRQTAKTVLQVAIYCRLSKDDGNISESSSIGTQRDMLARYAREQGWRVVDEYIDDGYSGLSFDRPDFKRMIADIEAGKINCVITKDLSRLGRNYLESGAYIEIFFPEHGVRYIALNDGVDSQNSGNMDITPFKNLLNELYSKDISKKIKSAKKARFQQGKFAACAAPYGYQKDPQDKNHLVIDENIAPVVRRIFGLAKQGLGISRIRKILTSEKIPRPAVDAESKGINYDRFFENAEENRLIWSNNSVRGVLRNPVYAGHLVGYKRIIPSMKSTKRLSALPEDWLIVRDTHEPIVPVEEWELVQRLITSRRAGTPGNNGYDNIFAGIIKCADCGYAMRTLPAHRFKKENPIDNMTYSCNNYCTFGREVCSNHTIDARDLHNAVLMDIQKHAQMAWEDDKKLLQRIISKLDVNSMAEVKSWEKERRQAEKRLVELDRLFASSFEDRAEGKISERNYLAMSTRYEREQDQLDTRITAIRDQSLENQSVTNNAGQFVSQIKEYAGITELSAPLINALIERITVEQSQIINEERCQTIHIYYKFIGCIE